MLSLLVCFPHPCKMLIQVMNFNITFGNQVCWGSYNPYLTSHGHHETCPFRTDRYVYYKYNFFVLKIGVLPQQLKMDAGFYQGKCTDLYPPTNDNQNQPLWSTQRNAPCHQINSPSAVIFNVSTILLSVRHDWANSFCMQTQSHWLQQPPKPHGQGQLGSRQIGTFQRVG
jgi:hypothetical protein